ncbi:MAG: 2Fe-2S iron-sulfur cluster-binding protein [Chlamydiota bacterium]
MAKLIFDNTKQEFELPEGSELKEPCEQAGVPCPCGEGVCGMCIVKILDGMDNLSEYTEAEKDFLGEKKEERLACQCKIKKGTVKLTY